MLCAASEGEKRPCPHHQGAFDPRWWCSGPTKMLHFHIIAELPSRKWLSYNCCDFCVSKHGDWKEVIQVQSCMALTCHFRQVRTEDGSTLLHHAASGNCAEVGPIRRNDLFKKPLTLKTNLRGSTTLSQAIPALIAAGVVHVPVVGQRHAND